MSKIDREKDKYREFMVTIRKDHGKENLQIEYHENYWEQHASLVRERIPRFLEDYAEKILKTGKYLNVVAECGKGGWIPECAMRITRASVKIEDRSKNTTETSHVNQ